MSSKTALNEVNAEVNALNITNEDLVNIREDSDISNITTIHQLDSDTTQSTGCQDARIPIISTPPQSPHRASLKSPYSPVLTAHVHSQRSASLYSPYKRPLSRSPLISPIPRFNFVGSDSDPFRVIYNEYMMVEPHPQHTRRRSLSFGTAVKKPVKETSIPVLPNTRLIDFPPVSLARVSRSKSLDVLPSARLSRRESGNKPKSLSLKIVFNTVSKVIGFSGSSLEELRNTINSCFLYLPVVKVCIEHPSIPNHIVNITDIDQLYDNAVIYLIPTN